MSPIYHPHQIISSNTHQTKVRLRASAYKITKTGQCFHLAIFDSTKTQPLLQINPTTAGIPNLGQILLQYHRNKKKLFIIPKSLNAKKKRNLGSMMKLYQVIYIIPQVLLVSPHRSKSPPPFVHSCDPLDLKTCRLSVAPYEILLTMNGWHLVLQKMAVDLGVVVLLRSFTGAGLLQHF